MLAQPSGSQKIEVPSVAKPTEVIGPAAFTPITQVADSAVSPAIPSSRDEVGEPNAEVQPEPKRQEFFCFHVIQMMSQPQWRG